MLFLSSVQFRCFVRNSALCNLDIGACIAGAFISFDIKTGLCCYENWENTFYATCSHMWITCIENVHSARSSTCTNSTTNSNNKLMHDETIEKENYVNLWRRLQRHRICVHVLCVRHKCFTCIVGSFVRLCSSVFWSHFPQKSNWISCVVFNITMLSIFFVQKIWNAALIQFLH